MAAYFARLAGFFGRSKYDEFHLALSRGRPAHRVAYSVAHGATRFRITAFLVGLMLYLLLPGLRIVPRTDIVFSGDTKNNRSALNEVAALISHRCDLQLGVASKRAGIAYRLRQLRAPGLVWRASALLPGARSRGAFLSLQLLVGAAALAFYEIELASRPCRLIALANDHSPIPTAVMFAARRHRIATVYRQHAPVTPEFPPLRVDLALLYDQVSCDAYRQAGARGGVGPDEVAMIILSPFTDSGHPVADSGSLTTVGICLSLTWNFEPVEALIDALLANDGMGAVILRAHPANQQDIGLLLARPGVTLDAAETTIEAFAEAIDLAIVPNSGVCLELLHLGVPTVYRAGMDPLGRDLYGFVEAGVIPDWTHRDMTVIGDVYSFFDTAWRARFARYDATQSRTPELMRGEARRALENLLDMPSYRPG